jgi:hypothetical protein
MNKNKIVPSLNEIEKEQVLKDLYAKHQIAGVSPEMMVKVRKHNQMWQRRTLTRTFYSLDCTGYKIFEFLIIWKNRTSDVLFAKTYDFPFEVMLAPNGQDFTVRVFVPTGTVYEHYTKTESGFELSVTKDCELFSASHREPNPHEWKKVHYHHAPEVRSIDNTVFYGYIERYG